MIKLQPIKDKNIYYSIIYKEIKYLLDRILFEPILNIASIDIISNAISSSLIEALKKGQISYADGYFTGKFNAQLGLEIRKMGGRWDKNRKGYYIRQEDISSEVKFAIARGNSITKEKIQKINEVLDNLQKSNNIPKINFTQQFNTIIVDIDEQYRITVAKKLSIPMTLSEFQKENLRREYTENLNKYISDLTIDSVIRLREKIQDKISQGYRASSLINIIDAQRGISDRHSLFIAKQETSILVSTYRDSRYQEAGIKNYIWSTSHDSRVRHDHKILDGKRFLFNKPPITDQATGARNNPGFDYGCRCIAIPILEDDSPVEYKIQRN